MEVTVRTIVTAHLPETGDAGLHRQPRLAPRHTDLILPERRRPRPNEAHLARQHVEELGEFVDVQRSKNTADTSDPRILVDLEMRTVRLIDSLEIELRRMRTHEHRSE